MAKTKKKGGFNWAAFWVAILAIILVVAIVLVGCYFGGVFNSDEDEDLEAAENSISVSRLDLSEEDSSAEYEMNQTKKVLVSVNVEDASGVTAGSWSLAWSEIDSDVVWSLDKDVNDYMTVTPVDDSGASLEAVVECLQPFAQQIILTAYVSGSTTIEATVTFDYVAALENVALSYFGNGSSIFLFKASEEGVTATIDLPALDEWNDEASWVMSYQTGVGTMIESYELNDIVVYQGANVLGSVLECSSVADLMTVIVNGTNYGIDMSEITEDTITSIIHAVDLSDITFEVTATGIVSGNVYDFTTAVTFDFSGVIAAD